MLKIDGHEFTVVVSDRELKSRDQTEWIIGRLDPTQNMIMVDGSLPDTRQAEVILHEIIHAADEFLVESQVRSLSNGLFGLLAENGLVSDTLAADIIDRPATDDEIDDVIAWLDTRAQRRRDGVFFDGADAQLAAHSSDAGSGQAGGDPPADADAAATAGPQGQSDSSDQGAASNGSSSDSDGPSGSSDSADGLGDEGKRALQGERSARKAADRRAATAEAKLKAIADENLSAEERTKAKNDELQAENTRLKAEGLTAQQRQAFDRAAHEAGVVDSDLAYSVVAGDLSVDDDGNVTGVEAAIAGLRDAKPFLFGKTSPPPRTSTDAGGGTGGDAGGQKSSVTPEQREIAAAIGANVDNL